MSQQDNSPRSQRNSALFGVDKRSKSNSQSGETVSGSIESTRIGPWLRALPILILVIGITVSLLASWELNNQIRTNANAVFDRISERIEDEAEVRLTRNERALVSLVAAFKVKRDDDPDAAFTAKDMRTWFDTQHAMNAYPGVRGFGYLERVRLGQEKAYEEAARQAGHPGFKIVEIGEHKGDHFVDRFVEPADRNIESIGMDVSGEPERRSTILRAIATGDFALTNPIILAQDEQKSPGFIFFYPVYHESLSDKPDSQERDRHLLGLMFCAIVSSEIFEGINGISNSVNIHISAASSSNAKTELTVYASSPGNVSLKENESWWHRNVLSAVSPTFEKRSVRVIGGKEISIRISTNDYFTKLFNTWMPLLLSGLGALLSIFLAALAHMSITSNKRASKLAREMTRQVRRLATVTRATTNAVSITDPNGRITWVNEGFERIVGMRVDGIVGRDVMTFLGFGPNDAQATKALLERCMRERREFRGEAQHIVEGHENRDVIVEMLPLFNDDGSFEGFVFIESDITERREAEHALEQERMRLANVIKAANAGIWEVSLSLQWLYADERLLSILDYESSRTHDGRLSSWLDMVHPQDRRLLVKSMLEHLRLNSQAIQAEVRILDGKQQWRWVQLYGMRVPIKGMPNEMWLSGTLQDITERKKKDAQLLASRAFLDATGEIAGVGGWKMDFENDHISFTNQTYRIFEWPDGLPIDPSKVISCIANYAREDVLKKTNQAVRAGEAFRTEVPIRTEAGSEKILAIFCQPQRNEDGKIIGLLGAAQDVTSRKEAEDAVRKSDALLRGAAEAINEAFVVFDAQDRLVFCNEKFRTTCAPKVPVEMLTQGVRFEDLLREGVRQGQFLEAVGREDEWTEARLRDRREGLGYSGISYHHDGRIFRVIDQRMADGHSVVFLVEITDLVRATQEAQEASKAKSQFLANMSHEIRTPMNAILGMLSLLGRTDLTERQRDYIGKTERAAKSLLGLLNDILDFSKVEAGKMTLDPHPFLVEDMLQNLSVILSATAAGKKIEVLYDVDPALPLCLVGDAMRLQQVLINLGGNAVKFTEQGEVVIALEAKTPVTSDSTEVTVEFSVRDTGIGIAEENIDKIFSGFTQAEASTTRRFGGTGLGVAICQRLIRLMDSELRVRSVVGEGSCFSFEVTLPIGQGRGPSGRIAIDSVKMPQLTRSTRSLAHDAGIAANTEGKAAATRVLIIDDSPTARAKLKRTFESAGWQVQDTASGKEALALLKAKALEIGGDPFDLIIVDWQMPEMDGWQTCHALRETDSGAGDARIIMVTAQSREMLASRDEADQSLIDAFVVKPVTLQMIKDACERGADTLSCVSRGASRAQAHDRVPRLQGLRILVAEDNPTNQQVAKELLEEEGALIEIAENGEIALQSLESKKYHFDIVLMDVQMPVMDGFVATWRIRKNIDFDDLPIIAMTANAMADDREKCLSAGMDEHIGKPFDIEELVAVIRRFREMPEPAPWLDAAPKEEKSSDLPAEIMGLAAKIGLDIEAAMKRMGGKVPTYQRLVGNFIKEISDLPGRMQALIHEGRTQDLARQAHSLKGLAGTLGIASLSRLAAQMEQRILDANQVGTQSNLTVLSATLGTMGPHLQKLHDELEKLDEVGRQSRSNQAVDTQGILKELRKLQPLLADVDMGALIVVEAMRELNWGNHAQALQALDNEVVELKFDQARERCASMIATLVSLSHDAHPAPVSP